MCVSFKNFASSRVAKVPPVLLKLSLWLLRLSLWSVLSGCLWCEALLEVLFIYSLWTFSCSSPCVVKTLVSSFDGRRVCVTGPMAAAAGRSSASARQPGRLLCPRGPGPRGRGPALGASSLDRTGSAGRGRVHGSGPVGRSAVSSRPPAPGAGWAGDWDAVCRSVLENCHFKSIDSSRPRAWFVCSLVSVIDVAWVEVSCGFFF